LLAFTSAVTTLTAFPLYDMNDSIAGFYISCDNINSISII